VKVHKTTEALSVFLQAPFMVYLASRRELLTWARVASAGLAVAILRVDGGLLYAWAANARGEAAR
jgi:hypothetical protein